MEQGLTNIPKGIRYTSLIWLAACTAFGTAYKSRLRHHISFPEPEFIPRTWREVADNGYETTLRFRGELELGHFRDSQLPNIVKIRKRFKTTQDMNQCLLHAFNTEKTTCVYWSPPIDNVIASAFTVNTRVKPFAFSKESAKRSDLTIGFKINSIYTDAYTFVTFGVFEFGLMDKWEKDENYRSKRQGVENWKNRTDSNLYKKLLAQTQRNEFERKPLTLNNLKAIFFLLSLGLFWSLLMFIMEIFSAMRQNVTRMRLNIRDVVIPIES